MFIMLTGSSGVGKNTLINELKTKNKMVMLMPTLTTRQMREGETEGNPFHFLTKDEFEEKIKNEELFEHECIHGNFYGSSKVIFQDCLQQGKVLMKDIGVEGALQLTNLLKEHTNTIKVFLTTKNKQVLIDRLKERGEKDIEKRLKRYPYEQSLKNQFDFIILNENKDQTVFLLSEIIKNENKLENLLFIKPYKKLNQRKMERLVKKYEKNPQIELVIKVCLRNGKIIVQTGAEELCAALKLGVPVCKQVKERHCKVPVKLEEQAKYQTYIKSIKKAY